MVVMNGKVSGKVHRPGHELNGHVPNGSANGDTKGSSIAEKNQELISSLKIARRELERISDLVSEQVANEVSNAASQALETTTSQAALENKLAWKSNSNLPVKQFQLRQSVLTDLFAIPHLRTAYNMAVVVFLMLLVNDAVEFFILGHVPIIVKSTAMMWNSFTGFHRALGLWMVMFLCTVSVYAAFTWWARTRSRLIYRTRKAFDYLCIAALIGYMALFTYLPIWRMRMYDLGLSSVAAVLLEQIRLLMKMHAFVRSNVPRALEATKEPIASQADDDEEEEEDTSKLRRRAYPGFSNYLYFLFAPTLVYRDEYPRTKRIRWGFVATCFFETFAVIMLNGYLLERFLLPQTRAFGKELPSGLATYISIVAPNILPFMLMIFAGHYLLLHTWQNAFAEMLRFGDRLFYSDWWNQKDYSTWFRTWNMVVQDWLFMYLYRDVALLTSNKNLAKMSVFLVSAVVHEYVLAITFQFCMPLQMFMFLFIGGAMAMLNLRSNSSLGNIFLVFSMVLGNTMMSTFYSIEYFARRNCPQVLSDTQDYFVPRSWNCTVMSS